MLCSCLLFVNPFEGITLGQQRLTLFLAVPPVYWMTWMSLFIFPCEFFLQQNKRHTSFFQKVRNVKCTTTHQYPYYNYKINLFSLKQMTIAISSCEHLCQVTNTEGHSSKHLTGLIATAVTAVRNCNEPEEKLLESRVPLSFD